MALILNLETTTEVCSVCLSLDGAVVQQLESSASFAHASELTLLIQRLMATTNHSLSVLDAVAVSEGPGSFTGLRVGVSVAKGICYALQKPLIAVDTLLALAGAMQAKGTGQWLCPMIDARRMEVYTALFRPDGSNEWETQALIVEEGVFAEVLPEGARLLLGGNGAAKCLHLFDPAAVTDAEIRCSAQYLVPLAEEAYANNSFADLAYFSPNYLKAPNITQSKKKGLG
jgi:tRNA threonylcarbamoyladenosine biosynthesis protein TsaB